MGHFSKIPHIDALIAAIRLISLDVDSQVAWLDSTGFHLDEISLQLGDFYYPVRGFIADNDDFYFPEEVEEGIVGILNKLSEVDNFVCSGEDPYSVLSSSGWVEVRAMAKELMAVLKNSEWSELIEG